MSEFVRSELSVKNKYYLNRERYFELKHFCLQYPDWKKARSNIDGLARKSDRIGHSNEKSDPTEHGAMERIRYSDYIEMIERTVIDTDSFLSNYILKGVTEGLSYDVLRVRYNIPCCRNTYYELYRKFFWLLDKERA